jgi:DNA primase
VNTTGYGFFCWQCGEKGSLNKLVQQILGISKSEAWGIMRRFETEPQTGGESHPPHAPVALLPPQEATPWPKSVLAYVRARKYGVETLRDVFRVYGTNAPGKFKNRLIIPIFFNKSLVSFTSRDCTGTSEAKYLNCSKKDSIIPVRNVLYGIDDAHKDIAVIVEGPKQWL